MKYLGKLLLSLKEIFIIMFLQYIMLFCTVYFMGFNKSIFWGSVFLVLFEIIYIIWKLYILKFDFKKFIFLIRKTNYFPYVLLGIGVNAVYNMIIFRFGLEAEVTVRLPIIVTVLCSGILGPIFEEILFRFDFIRRLEKFNSNKMVIVIISGIIFGIVHIDTISVIYGLIVGLINSYIYVNDKDYIKPIMVHMAGNILAQFLFGYNIWILILGIVLTIISALVIRNND